MKAIFDVVMPFMSGPEAAKCILDMDASLPFIFVTGCDTHQSLKQLCILQGFHILPKPIAFDSFLSLVQKLFAISTASS